MAVRGLFTRLFTDWGALPIRLALGIIFASHGWEKLNGPLGTPEGFNIESWGWPYPVFWAWLVALVEFVGGIFVAVGLLTRVAAAFIGSVLVVALLKGRLASGLLGGFELEFSLLMMALALLLTGGGRISVDRDVLGWGAPPVSSPVGETPYD